MYCPHCGASNDDAAASCSSCGFDLNQYQQQWTSEGAATGGQPESGGGAAQGKGTGPQAPGHDARTYQPPPYQGSVYQAPPYQQQYQRAYQAPPYQTGGYGRPPYGSIPRIPSYLGWAIAVLILCFWPTGIAAVVFASQVDNRIAIGDVYGAQESSRKAKLWCWISFGIGVAGWVIGIGIAVIVAVSVGVSSVTY